MMYTNPYNTQQYLNVGVQPQYNQPQYTPNPYIQPISRNQENGLQGKLIESEDIAKTIETPMNGSKIYLPLLDGSKIVVKQLTTDGTTKTTIYEVVNNENVEKIEYLTKNDLDGILKEFLTEDIEDIKDDINELKKALKSIKKEK